LLADHPRKHPRCYPAYHLACPLENAPATALTGQARELATPLATPIACIVPELWRAYYRDSLARTGIDYWSWLDTPEHDRVCPELNWLLSLPRPRGEVKEILEAIAGGRDLFYHPNLDLPTIVRNASSADGNNLAKLQDRKGKFADRDFRSLSRARDEFRRWHLQACQQVGTNSLKALYHVCYGVSWEFIAGILYPSKRSLAVSIATESAPDWWRVFGITPFTPPERVERIYKTLLRYWHPDRESPPDAIEITAHLDRAHERYRFSLEQKQSANASARVKNRSPMA
jgi:hypothetical protein